MSDYLDSLDKDQLRAVTAGLGPVKVVAGAGSGKTRVLTCRTAWMIDQGHVKPDQMFVSAFTKAAATEMQERLENLVDAEGLRVGTFHSLCYRLVQDERRAAGLLTLDVCGESERTRILQGLLGKSSKDFPNGIGVEADVASVSKWISTWKNEIILHHSQEILDTKNDAPYGSDIWAAAHIYGFYEKHLDSIGKLDYDDMLLKAYVELSTKRDALSRARAKWSAFLIDEAQDTNHVQWEIIKLIAPPGQKPNVTIVGDTRQCLYRFRGAIPELMDDFEKIYRGANVINMTKNYRSVNGVINHSNDLIGALNMPKQKGHRGKGKTPVAVEFLDQFEQGTEIAEFVSELRDSGRKGGEVAVLIRTNAQSAAIESAFVAAKLPYWCNNGGFFDRMEIGDVMGYLRLAANPKDQVALNRIINKPTRFLGKVFVEAVVNQAKYTEGNLVKALRTTKQYNGRKLWNKQLIAANELADIIESITPSEEDLISPYRAVRTIVEHEWECTAPKKADVPKTYLDWLRVSSGTSEGADDSRKENIDALLEITARYGNLKQFLDFVEEATKLQEESGDATIISTVHRAKGREWPVVICSNFYNGSIPHKMAVQEGGAQGVMDERRVAYVAFTRAQDVLVATTTKVSDKGEIVSPSPFLESAGLEVIEPPEEGKWYETLV